MSEDKLSTLIREIKNKYPSLSIQTSPYHYNEDLHIQYFLWILNVPNELLCKVENYTIERALELYGDEPLPFCVSAVSPEKTSEYFTKNINPEIFNIAKTIKIPLPMEEQIYNIHFSSNFQWVNIDNSTIWLPANSNITLVTSRSIVKESDKDKVVSTDKELLAA